MELWLLQAFNAMSRVGQILCLSAGYAYSRIKIERNSGRCGENGLLAMRQIRDWAISIGRISAAGDYITIGLKADGTVVAVGDNSDGQCDDVSN